MYKCVVDGIGVIGHLELANIPLILNDGINETSLVFCSLAVRKKHILKNQC